MSAIERLREIRARAPKAFDLGCAVLVGMVIAGLFFIAVGASIDFGVLGDDPMAIAGIVAGLVLANEIDIPTGVGTIDTAGNMLTLNGTINVNSWAPDSRRFAYVAYPMRDTA